MRIELDQKDLMMATAYITKGFFAQSNKCPHWGKLIDSFGSEVEAVEAIIHATELVETFYVARCAWDECTFMWCYEVCEPFGGWLGRSEPGRWPTREQMLHQLELLTTKLVPASSDQPSCRAYLQIKATFDDGDMVTTVSLAEASQISVYVGCVDSFVHLIDFRDLEEAQLFVDRHARAWGMGVKSLIEV